jgi:hypothetical protein
MFELDTDPPPIIIKSGSLTIESDQPLTPPESRQRRYFRNGLGRIRKIRVSHSPENPGPDVTKDFDEGTDWNANEKIQLSIDLQNNRVFSVVQNSNSPNLEFSTPINLSASRSTSHPTRPEERKDEEQSSFNFGLVLITKGGNDDEVARFEPVNGREYTIGIYPHRPLRP